MSSTFLNIEQAYWWLSLLGSLHCFLLSINFLGRCWRKPSLQFFTIGTGFALLFLFFFSGVAEEFLREPWQTWFNIVMASSSFFILPLCYQYFIVTLFPEGKVDEKQNVHYISTCFIVSIVFVAYLVDPTVVTHSPQLLQAHVWGTGVEKTSQLIPNLLFIQAGVYLLLMYRLLSRCQSRLLDGEFTVKPKQDIHWLKVVAGFIFMNWLLAIPELIFAQWLVLKLDATIEVIMHFTWLLSLYLLTLYRMQQLIHIQSDNLATVTNLKDKPPILNEEERKFINSVLKQDP